MAMPIMPSACQCLSILSYSTRVADLDNSSKQRLVAAVQTIMPVAARVSPIRHSAAFMESS